MMSFSFQRALRNFAAPATRWLFKLSQVCLVGAISVPIVSLLLSVSWRVPWAKIQTTSGIFGAIAVAAFASGVVAVILSR
jgi:hypothetical protein